MHRLANRSIIALTGPDTLALLERTVTHTVADWHPGEARYGALLAPQGKVIADYIAHRTPEGVLIDVHQDAADDLVKRLKMFRLRAAVDIAREAGLVAASMAGGAPDPRSSELPHRSIVPASLAAEPLEDWDGRAIGAGVPEWGRDYRAAEVFPTDVNMDLMGGIDYRKGCFVGQEVASRMKRKGLIRKRTLMITGAALAPGAELRGGSDLLGTVTSVCGGRGLALVRTDRYARSLREQIPLTVNGSPAGIQRTDWLDREINALMEAHTDD